MLLQGAELTYLLTRPSFWNMILWGLPKFSCALSRFRILLEEGKATVPRLAERLTVELIGHISVSWWVEVQGM